MKTIKYPWQEWFETGNGELKQGRDFNCTIKGMRQQLRDQAAERRLQLHIEVDWNEAVIRWRITGKTRHYGRLQE